MRALRQPYLVRKSQQLIRNRILLFDLGASPARLMRILCTTYKTRIKNKEQLRCQRVCVLYKYMYWCCVTLQMICRDRVLPYDFMQLLPVDGLAYIEVGLG